MKTTGPRKISTVSERLNAMLEPKHEFTLFIAGSRYWATKQDYAQMRDYVRRVVRRAAELGWTILVGDNAHGVDQAVIEEANSIQYKNIIVVGVQPEPRSSAPKFGQYHRFDAKSYASETAKGISGYTLRDRWLGDCCNRALMIWNGESKGTYAVYKHVESRKSVPVDLKKLTK